MEEERLSDKEFWEGFYARQKANIVSEKGKYLLENHLRKIFRKYLPLSDQSFIEFGCGNSDWLPYFGKFFGFSVSGIDYSERGIALIKKKLEINDVLGDIYFMDFFNLPGEFFNRFNIAASFGVIEHFEHPYKVLRIFSDTLIPKGLMVTVVPKMTGIQGWLQKTGHRDIFLRHKALELAQFIDEHKKAGLEIVAAVEIGLITLGINLGERKILRYLYRIYSKILNVAFRVFIPYEIVNKLHLGSGFVIIARKSNSVR